MSETQREGLVVRRYGGFYYVFTGEAVLACKLRGKIRDQVVTGDRVVITVLGTGTGVVEKVLPRRTELVRPRIANVDKVFIVFSCNCPEPSLVLLDRLLVLASCHGLYPYIVLNKCDLDPAPRAVDIIDYYPRAGYKLILTSAVNGEGIDEVVKEVEGSISVLAGPSGVGKSSLLNAVFPDRYLPTQEISEKTGRGRHTTRHVELFSLENGGWIADTPGFSVMDLPRMKREDLARHFIEFDPLAAYCRFADCLHYQEENCAVKESVSRGEIAQFRYQNYCSFLGEVIEAERCYR
ncbi:MAG TPA: ribosome small subunit-dependent GTPase A [Syntrophothermus lipocalidus]|nr:ribosome small subunit-dependent GTPase A [Syntrophothermus lipocalidus]